MTKSKKIKALTALITVAASRKSSLKTPMHQEAHNQDYSGLCELQYPDTPVQELLLNEGTSGD